jgi:hypothetical protein
MDVAKDDDLRLLLIPLDVGGIKWHPTELSVDCKDMD